MFPKDCSHVSVTKVSFPLTEEEIMKEISKGKMVFESTDFVILTNGYDYAVLKVEKAQNSIDRKYCVFTLWGKGKRSRGSDHRFI